MVRMARKLGQQLALAGCLLAFLGGGAWAGTLLTVVNSGDSGSGSLREALTNYQNGSTILFSDRCDPILASAWDIKINNRSTLTISGNSRRPNVITMRDAAKFPLLTYDNATVGSFTLNASSLNLVQGVGDLYGGGLVGRWTYNDTAVTGTVTADPAKVGNLAELAIDSIWVINNGAVFGGGLFGASTYADGTSSAGANVSAGAATVGNINGSFSYNSVTTNSLIGGGLIGASVYAEAYYGSATAGAASIGTIGGSFVNNVVNVTGDLLGGGIVGAYSTARIGVTTGTVGAATIDTFLNANFSDNQVTVGGDQALAGVAAAPGLNKELLITNSSFTNNSLTATAAGANAKAGALYIGTDRAGTTPKVNLTADAGKTTRFENNLVNTTADSFRNAIHFGREAALANTLNNASLTISPQATGSVLLYDPVTVDMNNDKSFTMTMSGRGDFEWGGSNNFNAAGAGGSHVYLNSGYVVLMPDFQLQSSGSNTVNVTLKSDLNLYLNLANRPEGGTSPMFLNPTSFAVDGGGKVNILGVDYSTLYTVEGEWLIASANYNGTTENDFKIIDSDFFTNTLSKRNGNQLWIKFDNSNATKMLFYHDNGNVRHAYRSGAFEEAWQKYYATNPSTGALAAIYGDLINNPQTYFPGPDLGASGNISFFGSITAKTLSRSDNQDFQATQQASVASASGLASPASCFRPRSRVFASYLGNRIDQDDSGGDFGYKAHLNGVLAAYAFDFTPCFTLGASFTYAHAKSTSSQYIGHGKTNLHQAGLYAVIRPTDNLRLNLDVAAGWHDNSGERQNLSGIYSADYDSNHFGAGFSAAYDYYFAPATRLTPLFSARYQHYRQDGFSENFAPESNPIFANNMAGFSANSFVTSLGAEIAHDFRLASATVTPSLSAAWQHEFGDRSFNTTANFQGSSIIYDVSSIRRNRDSADLAAEIKAAIDLAGDKVLELRAGYGLNVTKDYTNQGWYAGVGLRF